ncbi:MAG: hypothetical protein RDU20_14770 [Desulfomonilaceae bacterium]|nr:hypothetical protein [Desulfomonilaceae bacterium]
MDELKDLTNLFEKFKEALARGAASKRSQAVKKLTTALDSCIKLLVPTPKKPTQKDLKEQLLADGTALRIRSVWNNHKAIIDLPAMAREVGITLKKPTIDHLIIAYYHPENRLKELATRLDEIAANDPARIEIDRFQKLRGELRALRTREEMESAVERLVDEEGIEMVRRFAGHLNAKDSSGKRKLPKNASQTRVIDAVSAHLWKEKMVSKAQEGRL